MRDGKFFKAWLGHPEEMRPELPEWVKDGFEPFDVHGAGLIFLSKSTDYSTGDVKGFSFMDSTCIYGLTPGVIDASEARRMADYIYAVLDHERLAPQEKL